MQRLQISIATFVKKWNFAAGVCYFDDQTCWFNHTLKRKTFSTPFQCKACDKTFTIRSHYLKHNKQNHPNSVPTCKNIIDGKCKFGDGNCWFMHENIEKIQGEKIENNEMIQRTRLGLFNVTTKLFCC